MRGEDEKQGGVVCVIVMEQRVPQDHPLRKIRDITDRVLKELSPVFDAMYSRVGRPSVPPERLLKSMLLMALYTVRSERLFCEQLSYNLLFRWFLDMDLESAAFDASTFSKNRDRLLEHDVAGQFFRRVVEEARRAGVMSDDHFTVDGTLIEAWASLKSFRPKKATKPETPPDDPGNPTVNFHGEKRSNDTHASTTDPEAKLARKGNGKEAKLCFHGHGLTENRNGLLVDVRITEANGRAEREAALEMIGDSIPGTGRVTVGADKGYDTRDFVRQARDMSATPHVAQNDNAHHRSAIDGRTTKTAGYSVSQRLRKRIEETWGWMKTVGNFRKTRWKGKERTQLAAYMVGAAYNLLRLARLQGAAA
jgi:transposase